MSWLDAFSEIRARDWSKEPEVAREKKAKEVVTMTAYASAAAAAVPVPFVDLALLLPFHSAMVMTVGHVFGRKITETEAKRVAVELGAVAGVTVAARAGLTALKKLVLPGIGGVLAAPASFAATWAFGRVTIAYFKDPNLSRDELSKVFKDAFAEAGQYFSKDTFDKIRNKKKVRPEDVAADVPPTPEPAPEAKAPPPPAAEAATTPEPAPPADPSPPPEAPRPGAPLSGLVDDDEDASDAPSVRPKKRNL